MAKEEKAKKDTEEKKEVPKEPKKGSDSAKDMQEKDKAIVIEETEDDVLTSEINGDPDDFKNEVKKEAEKGRFTRILVPILFFVAIGALIGFATWYYNDQNNKEEPKNVEEKIQTPPTVTEDEKEEEPVEESTEEPKEEPTTEAESEYTTYTVKAGDTLSGIANDNDMTSKELADYNGLKDTESLQIGQKLKIPTN
jgi:LysM repeat protein